MSLTRRQFAATLAAGAARSQPRAAPWNLLLITNDQFRADCLGAMGNRVIRTPNLDRLASQGVLYEQYYVQCPQCVPSRSALHTGRYPHVNRTPSNLYQLPNTEETLAGILRRRGYETAVVGEMPFAPTKFLGGFERVVASDAEYNASLRAAGWSAPAAAHAEAIRKDFQAVAAPWPAAQDESAFFAARAIGYLDQHRDRPFFLHVNFRRPHHPFDPPPPFDRLYADAVFPPAHQRPGEMRNKPPAQQRALENSVGFDLRTLTAADLHRIKSYYYGMISENDECIGRILDQLDRLQLAGRTVVVFNSDHGEMLGDHGLLFKGGYFYDEVVHVPLILRAPVKLAAGKRVNGLYEEIDLLPALLDLLEIETPPGVQGKNLLRQPPRSSVHAEFANIKMLRTRDWKLVHYLHAPYGELYNLRDDPHELANLYDDPSAAAARHRLEAELIDWLIDSQDPLLAPLPAQP